MTASNVLGSRRSIATHTAKLTAPLAAAALLAAAGTAQAQTNVRAWYAQGQVFVIWELLAAPPFPTHTYEIYASPAAQATTANMQRLGRLFQPEYQGARLTALQPGARLQVPTPAGGTYRLAASEGVFAFTPRQAGNLFFAVVETGNNVVAAANSAASAFNYDPINDPIRAHPQFSGTTTGGHPYTAFVVFADGRDDFNNSRPDFPVTADADKNGVPHVFTVTRPLVAPPPGPLACLFALHGGGGEYQLFRPGMPARANVQLPLTNGLVVTPDDSYYANIENSLERSNTSWFGYTTWTDPFSSLARTNPPAGSIVVNFTSRRVFWILDWMLRQPAPNIIDPNRVAIVGHSGGGRGTSHISRLHPERFSAAVVYTPASDLSQESAGRDNFLRGDWDQNLPTNLSRAGVGTLNVTDVFTMTTKIAPTARDFALTRLYYGKRDQEGAASWSIAQRSVIDSLNDSRMGYMISWDEREHGVEKWTDETPDFNDGNPDPWPDVAQWLSPDRSARCAGQYLVDTYRANQSYPGFFNADHDLALAGRQPDPGPGDPSLGDPWGTWEGYCEFDTSTLIDLPGRWEATLYLTGLSAVPIDNSPVSSITVNVAPRKTRNFNPLPGIQVFWTAVDVATNLAVQTGTSVTESDGVVVVAGLNIPRDPDRIRLILRVCPADFNLDATVDFFDYLDFVAAFDANDPSADFNRDGSIDFFDYLDFVALFDRPC
jgi:predicted esterase